MLNSICGDLHWTALVLALELLSEGQSETRGKGTSCERINSASGISIGPNRDIETINLGSTSDSDLGAFVQACLSYLLDGTRFKILTLRSSRAELYTHSC